MFQCPHESADGEVRMYDLSTETAEITTKAVPSLPDYYTVVPAAALDVKAPKIPTAVGNVRGETNLLSALNEHER